jgi:hypothetical protein
MADTTETNFEDFFGTASIAGSGEKTTYHKIKDGSNVYRFAPPNRTLAPQGRWWVNGALHYGYTMPNEKDPSKPFHKPFICIQKKNWDTGMITEECPECTLIETKNQALKDAISARVEANLRAGMPKADAERDAEGSVKLMKRWFQDHNLDRKVYILAKNEAGQWGVLPIRTTARKAVEEAFKKYEKTTGKNPLDPRGGVWIDITRSGSGIDTVYSATVVLVPQADGSMRFKDAGLTAADMNSIKALPDLANIHDRNKLNYDQVKVLADSDNNSEVVGRIFRGTVRGQAPAAAATPTLADAVRTTAPTALPPAPVVSTSGSPVVAAPTGVVVVPDMAAMMAQLAELQRQLAAAQAAPAPVTKTEAPAAPSKSVKDMSADEYMKKFGNL